MGAEFVLEIAAAASLLTFVVTHWITAARQFRRGYLLALDHTDQMIRISRVGGYSTRDAVQALREEMGVAKDKRARR